MIITDLTTTALKVTGFTSNYPFVLSSLQGGYSGERLPSDSIGSTSITLQGVPAGCEIRIRDKDTNELDGVESCIENPSFSWPVYTSGSDYNNVRIIIISTSYLLIDLQYTASIGSFSIPIEMRPDPWFNDPV